MNEDPLNQKIEFVKGVGPHKASLLNKEIGIYTLYDMLHYFPFRYEDRSEIKKISNITEDETDGVYLVQVLKKTSLKKFKNKTLKVKVKDNSGYAELIWVKGIEWVYDKIIVGKIDNASEKFQSLNSKDVINLDNEIKVSNFLYLFIFNS